MYFRNRVAVIAVAMAMTVPTGAANAQLFGQPAESPAKAKVKAPEAEDTDPRFNAQTIYYHQQGQFVVTVFVGRQPVRQYVFDVVTIARSGVGWKVVGKLRGINRPVNDEMAGIGDITGKLFTGTADQDAQAAMDAIGENMKKLYAKTFDRRTG